MASIAPQSDPPADGGKRAQPAPELDRSFERLYRRYVSEVYRYALALLRDPADAEDVTQTTFTNAYRAMKNGEQPRVPHNWLIKIAHNTCKTRYVKRARESREIPLDDVVDDIAVPEEQRTDVKSVLRALGTLPFNQRSALVMRELEGRSYPEIAQTLGVSVSAVETLLFRARRSLRNRTAPLRALGAVQIPSSLSSFFESGSGALAGGGALLGTGLAFKAAALLVAGAVAGGVAYSSGLATDRKDHPEPRRVGPAVRDTPVFPSAAVHRTPVHAFATVQAKRGKTTSAVAAVSRKKTKKAHANATSSTVAQAGPAFPNPGTVATEPPAASSSAAAPAASAPRARSSGAPAASHHAAPPARKPVPTPKAVTTTAAHVPPPPKVVPTPTIPAVTVPAPPPVPTVPAVTLPTPPPVTVPAPPPVPKKPHLP